MIQQAKRADDERLLALHARLLAGDAGAADELATLLLTRVRRGLRADSPRAAPEDVETAADDAVMIYVRNPAKYDPARASLVTWLVGIARKRLKHLERERRRRLARERPTGVDFSSYAFVAPTEGAADPAEREMAQQRALRTAARTPAERALVEAKLDGAPLEAQVQACGLKALPEAKARIYRMWESMRTIRNVALVVFFFAVAYAPCGAFADDCWAPSGQVFDEYEDCWYQASIWCTGACNQGCGEDWRGYGEDPEWGVECYWAHTNWLLRCRCGEPFEG